MWKGDKLYDAPGSKVSLIFSCSEPSRGRWEESGETRLRTVEPSKKLLDQITVVGVPET